MGVMAFAFVDRQGIRQAAALNGRHPLGKVTCCRQLLIRR